MGRIPVRWPAPVDTAGAPPASDPVKGAAIEPVRPVAATVPAQAARARVWSSDQRDIESGNAPTLQSQDNILSASSKQQISRRGFVISRVHVA